MLNDIARLALSIRQAISRLGVWMFPPLPSVEVEADAGAPEPSTAEADAAAGQELELANLRARWTEARVRQASEKEARSRELRAKVAENPNAWWERQGAKPGAGPAPEDFYRTRAWQRLRYDAFKRYGRRCALCGRTPEDDGVTLHVDHIKPRSLHPELALSIGNLQILIEDYNLGKGTRDRTK